jgi:predicted GH43/DUF377 family glycosyl hydrolase
MIQRVFQQLLIRPEDVAPWDEALEVIGAFNPGAIADKGGVVLLVRIAECPQEQRDGFTGLPRWEAGRVVTDWVADDRVEALDPRVVRLRETGLLRLTFTSHLCVVRSTDGRHIDQWNVTRLFPHAEWEEYGIEDPRIVELDGRYWITYVAVSRHGAATALASTDDFITFERHGIIFCPENKDVVLFPQRIGGQYVALHRPTTAHPFCRPEMWMARSPDLLHWGSHRPLHGGSASWESDRVGAGTPPLQTERGWLEIYHASRRSGVAGQVGTYAAGAMLLDLEDPSRIVAFSRRPLWEPDAEYEIAGFVPRVVFPTGIVVRDDTAQLYYGAADTSTAMAEFRLSELTAGAMLQQTA